MVLPSCTQQNNTASSLALKNLQVTGKQEELLAELAETILPATATPGAKDLYLHQFALRMVDDCNTPDEQRAFEQGLKAFDNFTRKKFDRPFAQLAPKEKTTLLQQIEDQKDIPEAVVALYKKVKGLTIQGYLGSKYYLTQVQVYELVPGRYKGCVPLSELNRSKAV